MRLTFSIGSRVMRSSAVWAVLAVAAILADGGRLLAQFPSSGGIPARAGTITTLPRVGDAILPTPERRGAPIETLQALTGEQVAEPGRERESGGEGEGEPDEIETDRDSFTPATTLAGRGRLIVESAYSFIDN